MPTLDVLDQDTFIRPLAQVIAIGISVALTVTPVWILAVIMFDLSLWDPILSRLDPWLGDSLIKRADLVTLIVGVAPVAVRSVCYSKSDRTRLNVAGKLICIISLVGLVCAIIAGQYLRSSLNDAKIEPTGILGSSIVYQNLANFVEISISVYLFYIACFFGFTRP